MKKTAVPSSFLFTVAAVWAVLIAAAILYAQAKQVPAALAIPIAAAFLIETIFYLIPGFELFREQFPAEFPLFASALIPFLVYSIPTGQFHLIPFLALIAIAALAAWWYRLFPRIWQSDVAYIVFLAAIILSRVLKYIYASPIPKVPLDLMGHLMLIHIGAMVMLLHRRLPGIGFGFLPAKDDFLIGAKYFLYFAPVGALVGWQLGVFRFRGRPLWQAIGVFLGVLWMVALSEEFAFRGVIQQSLRQANGNRWIALVLASMAFGSVHLWYPGGFPNWRMAILASIAGAFYGKAFEEGGNIKAAMVTHAITVTVWLTWLA
jgi:membrane protease YdiL (CAAX protease family)